MKKPTKCFLPILLLLILLTAAHAEEDFTMALKVGEKAPNFKLKDQNGKIRTLSEFKGNKLVLYFYPKDNTPGCTKEACSFRDDYSQIKKKGITVLGVSYDSEASHKKFIETFDLPFDLLIDDKKDAAKAYGAYKGIAKSFTPKRITFLIDEKGEIVHIFEKVNVKEHAREVLEAFAALAKKE